MPVGPDRTEARRKARQLINNIAQEHTLNGAIFGTQLELLVNNCLETLSKQLYEKNTHFLLELVQNADDNTYTCATPTLSFIYKPGCFRIDCNEVGFDASNVTAICGIGQSTKSGKTSDGEFIGEKGIGFKSVFQAADAVRIASNEFTFKFDRTKPLGVITPLWEESPEQTESHGTSIFLQLSEAYNEKTLVKELQQFDINLLIFLRQVEQINIEIDCAGSDSWDKQIRKTQYEQNSDHIVLLQTQTESLKFLTRRHAVRNLPQEARRKNWTETYIVMAFPLPSEQGKPMLKPQNVYAFLPIRNYGFRFLIQADFILTASREDIESTLPWNISLREALSEAFISSIVHFNEGVLKYIWPFYLPSSAIATSGFFEPAIKMILIQVEESPVFESCGGSMVRPATLSYVPAEYCVDGEPFTLCKATEDQYLSSNYASWVIEAMASVGVTELTPRQLLRDLATLITTDANSFHKRSFKWQTQLATTLLKFSTDAELMSLMRDLALIPLNDGTWIAARDNNIFFSRSDASLAIPDGIGILIVDRNAESDSNRRNLFTTLGIKEWSAPGICRLILSLHASADFQPERSSMTQIVSHATFLYQAKWQLPKGADLWFVTTRSERFRGREIYVPGSSNVDSAAARVFAVLEKDFPVIHDYYLTVLPGDCEFVNWLVQYLGLSRIPRLVTPVVEPKPLLAKTEDQLPMKETDPTLCNNDSPSGGSTVLGRNSTKSGSRLAYIVAKFISGNILGRVNRRSVAHSASELTHLWKAHIGVCDQCQKETWLRIRNQRELACFTCIRHYQLKCYCLIRWLSLAKDVFKARACALIVSGGCSSRVTLGRVIRGRLRIKQPEDLPTTLVHELAHPTVSKVERLHERLAEDSSGLPEQLPEPKELLFDLSKEFNYILHECESSDVLQLLRDNWHHYSQWIEGAHLNWQGKEYVFASAHLKNRVGESLVQTSRGRQALHETVLAKLDPQMDQGNVVPALCLHQPEDTGWNILTHFGVKVKSDVHYYLRCLATLSRDEAPNIDVVGYIYEQIQSKYTGNEGLIRAAFYSKRVILVTAEDRIPDSQACWSNMESCISQGIDLTRIYASCSYLFRCLYSPGGDPIGGLVHAMTMISSFSQLEDIAHLFREVSKLLKDVNSNRVTLLLKPVQDRAIIPVLDGSKKTGYDRLLSVQDTTWFIADNANLLAGFTGVVPLLAFPIQDLPAIEDFLRALRVDGRKISLKSTSQTRVVGRARSDYQHADDFRRKMPFLKALIPRNHPAEATLRRQITNLRVRIATSVHQTFTLNLPNKAIIGKPIPGHVCIRPTDNSITLAMTEETARAACPSHELVSALALTCGIHEQLHVTLLHIALGDSSLKRINAAFLQHGIKVEGLLLEDDPDEEFESKEGPFYAIEGIDDMSMPSLMADEMKHSSSGGLALSEGIKFEAQESGHNEQSQDLDRRIPMLPRIKGAGNTYLKIRLSEIERKEDAFVESDHVQFLGESMVARLLSVHLGSSFDPVRDWTSDLRERAGLTYIPEDSSVEPFTLAQAETIRRMTNFVTQYGVSWCDGWQERLRNSSPTYHVDVLTSGDATGRFVMEAKWLERTMKMKLPSHPDDEIVHVNVLIHVGQAYSEDDFSIDMIVDPWHLIYSGKLKFTKNWLMQGSLDKREADWHNKTSLRDDGNVHLDQEVVVVPNEDKQLMLYTNTRQISDSGTIRVTQDPKTRTLNTLYLPWSQNEATGILQCHGQPFHTTGRRKLYSYKPLLHGYIRILYLLPSTTEGPLHAVLNHIACNYAGTYQALSYVWGSDVRDKELSTPDGIIPITSSLCKALLALRQREQGVMIWVDAVCLNQSDPKEKAQQIRLMPEIYQASECTYAFLSEGSPATDQALEMLMEVRARAVREKQQQAKRNDADENSLPGEMSTWGSNRLPPLDSPLWSSVKTLFSLPYFRRAWIIQEVVAAPNVKLICGKWLIGWKDMCAAQEILDREVQMMEHEEKLSDVRASWEPFKKLAVQREWEMRQHRWILLKLLEHFRYAESTLRRDRLFCLVGLASDGGDVEFEPDYHSSFEDIVLRFAQAFVRQGRGIQLLYHAGLSGSELDTKHPSWIPDWTSKRHISLYDPSNTNMIFSACGPQPQNLKLGPEPEELSVDGYSMDTILTITTAANTEHEWPVYFSEIDTMIASAVLSISTGPKEELRWKAPIAASPFPSAASYSAFRKHLTNPSDVPTSDHCRLEVDAYKTYAECLQGTLSGWKFVVTERGFAGVVPGLSQVGDRVAIMKGACVPFLLRESGEKFKLIGECYVHGIMKGEGLWLPGVVEKTFCLH